MMRVCPILILDRTISKVRFFWLLVGHFFIPDFIAFSLFVGVIFDQRLCHLTIDLNLIKGLKSSGEHNFIETREMGFFAARSTMSLPRMLQCEGHQRNERVLPLSFKSFQHENILDMMGLEKFGLEIAVRALSESLMTKKIRADMLDFFMASKQRRIAISSAEKIELMGLREKDSTLLSTLKAQPVEVGDLEPSVKHSVADG